MKIKIKKLHAESKVPFYATEGDAGLDLFSDENLVLKPGERQGIKTGISIELPLGYVGLVWDKSGISFKSGIKVMGGVMDAGYRGEYMVCLANLSEEDFHIEKGKKIAQLLIQKVEHPEIEEASELSETERGEGGFGHTGE